MMRTRRTHPSQCISPHITSCCSNIHPPFVLSSLIIPLCSISHLFLLFGCVLDQGLRVVIILICVFFKGIRVVACYLFVESSVELLSFLCSSIFYSRSLSSHLHTTHALTPTHSHRSRSFPLHRSHVLSPRNMRTHALNLQGRQDSFTIQFVSVYPGTFTIPTN